jgi:hypothetical protein
MRGRLAGFFGEDWLTGSGGLVVTAPAEAGGSLSKSAWLVEQRRAARSAKARASLDKSARVADSSAGRSYQFSVPQS